MKGQVKLSFSPPRLVLAITVAVLVLFAGLHVPSPASALERAAPHSALLGHAPVLDDNQSDCVTKARGAAIYSNDADARAACGALLDNVTPKSPATFDTLIACFIDGAGTKSLSESVAIAQCRSMAQAGNASTICGSYSPLMRELLDGRIDG